MIGVMVIVLLSSLTVLGLLEAGSASAVRANFGYLVFQEIVDGAPAQFVVATPSARRRALGLPLRQG